MAQFEMTDEVQQDAINDDALLRYNTCVRLIAHYRLCEPMPESSDLTLE